MKKKNLKVEARLAQRAARLQIRHLAVSGLSKKFPYRRWRGIKGKVEIKTGANW